MMILPDALAHLRVCQLLTEFNWRLDQDAGRRVHELFTPDGVYDLNGVAVAGRDAIRDGYANRASGVTRTSVHVTTDVRVDRGERGYGSTSTMQVFAADGQPPLVGTVPAVVATVHDDIIETGDELLFARRTLSYVFVSGAALSTPASQDERPA